MYDYMTEDGSEEAKEFIPDEDDRSGDCEGDIDENDLVDGNDFLDELDSGKYD